MHALSLSAAGSVAETLSKCLHPIDHLFEPKIKSALPPIFITGSARSGTTLFYQALCRRYNISYTPRVLRYFRLSPLIGARLSLLLPARKWTGFQSLYGEEKQLTGIAQCHQIWGRFFVRDATAAVLQPHQKRELIRIVDGLSGTLGAPLALKWPGFSAHLPPLIDTFPNAFYLFVSREISAVVRSHHKARQTLRGSPSHPISRFPAGSQFKPSADPLTDIFSYVRAVNHAVQQASRLLNSEQFLQVEYEKFCANPSSTLDIFQTKYESWSGGRLQNRHELPDRFEISPGPKLPASEEAQIASLINNDTTALS